MIAMTNGIWQNLCYAKPKSKSSGELVESWVRPYAKLNFLLERTCGDALRLWKEEKGPRAVAAKTPAMWSRRITWPNAAQISEPHVWDKLKRTLFQNSKFGGSILCNNMYQTLNTGILKTCTQKLVSPKLPYKMIELFPGRQYGNWEKRPGHLKKTERFLQSLLPIVPAVRLPGPG